MDNNNTEKDFSTFVFDSESADGEVTEIRDVQSAGETFQFSDISEVNTVSVSGSDAFPTGELENAGAVFAGAIGEDFTDPTEDDADPAADSETAVESAAVIFHASDAHREKKARKGNDQGWLAGMTGRNGGFDWRKPIAALILLAMCGVALFYYGGVVKASTADPRLSATSFLTDLTSYHKAEVVDAAPAPVIASGREVIIVGTSVEEDMSIRVEDENGERVTGIAFEFAVTSPDEDVQYYTDDDMDGTMYIDGIPEGTYSVELLEIAGYKAENIEVEVLPKVARQMIENISEKIVDSSEIVASQDDPNYGGTTGAGADPGVSSDVGNTVPHVDTDEKEEERVVTTVKYTCEVEKDTGRLLKKDGTPSDYVPEIDKDGYMTGYYRVYKAPPAPSEDGYAFRWSAGEGGQISVVTCSSGALNSGDKVPEGADITLVAEATRDTGSRRGR